jgi:hypothetical protein
MMQKRTGVALVALWYFALAGCSEAPSAGVVEVGIEQDLQPQSHEHADEHSHSHDYDHDHDHNNDHADSDMRDLMNWVLDPAADVIWQSAGSVTTVDGTEDLAPTNDEGWDRVRHAAAVVSESGKLLMLPGRARDEGAWKGMSRAMVDIGARTAHAAERRDAEAIFDLGGELYTACLACHQRYAISGQPDAASR